MKTDHVLVIFNNIRWKCSASDTLSFNNGYYDKIYSNPSLWWPQRDRLLRPVGGRQQRTLSRPWRVSWDGEVCDICWAWLSRWGKRDWPMRFSCSSLARNVLVNIFALCFQRLRRGNTISKIIPLKFHWTFPRHRYWLMDLWPKIVSYWWRERRLMVYCMFTTWVRRQYELIPNFTDWLERRSLISLLDVYSQEVPLSKIVPMPSKP